MESRQETSADKDLETVQSKIRDVLGPICRLWTITEKVAAQENSKEKENDRVWHDVFLYELKLLGICSRYYNLIQSFLHKRHQRVVLSGQSSKWSLVEAGVPQGSILEPTTLPYFQ